jgi:hypothetical protein
MYKYLFFLLLITSCANPKKLHKMMDKLPEASAKECADRFPIKETIEEKIIVDSSLLNQYEIEFQYMAHLIDSLLLENCDTVQIEKIKEVIKKVPCKPEIKVITKIQENTAKQQVIIDSCQKLSSLLNKRLDIETQKVKELTDKNEKLSKQRDNLFWLIVLLIISLFRRPLLRIITKTIKPI